MFLTTAASINFPSCILPRMAADQMKGIKINFIFILCSLA